MKIPIIVTLETLAIVTITLQPVYNTRAHTRREKSALSIAFDVSKKIESKTFSLKGQPFGKKVTISLKHHEADMLELLLIDQIKNSKDEFIDEFIKTKIQGVINQINQKLA
ncbi:MULTISPECIES: hypothetical protein [Flavobacterium]|uniref:Uncharacterized protein n=2 Tax=Flavobacterium columnare TaxID=996 RepID=A0AA94JP30_9FLAO|nr:MULTISPECIES: hypothetical protein [Flavobacterium]MCH4828910.1 hypothetical protein [Flavobacterium columnare]MCH4829806.1 hypothetical protein [Flavobacterium columnare]MCH4831635.1 hypothetical protein [Flavobacterium columnare]MCH4831672.1 hypothetical protein [Flavobacterium columnare]MCH4832816.1 hypothetical protein [Flavobacterium columnare]